MASATRTRANRATEEARKVIEQAAGVSPPATRYAQAGDLGPPTQAWEDVALPHHGVIVRVRYLSTAEVIRLSYLPDVTGLVQQMSEELKKTDKKTPRKTKPIGEFLAEQTEIKQRLAHVAIADSDKGETPERCEVCTEDAGGHEVQHRPSLFSPVECGGLTGVELELVENVALKRQGMGFLRPFSVPTPDSSSEPSAATGT